MSVYQIILPPFLILLSLHLTTSREPEKRGWGQEISWTTLEAAKKDNFAHNTKPIMIIIHQTWCGACGALKRSVSTHKGIAELSSEFLMINSENDEEPESQDFAPDGAYYPRIFFLEADGKVRKDVYNRQGIDKYKYYYTSGDEVYAGMVEALKKIGKKDREL